MRYKRLNYGTKSAQDILQIEMLNILAGIENPSQYLRQRNGRGTTVEHDAALAKILERLRESGKTACKIFVKKALYRISQI